jgi:hypothetical protein
MAPIKDCLAGELKANANTCYASEEHMTTHKSELPPGWWLHNIDEVDREIARLATICDIRILDSGVVERILHKDDSVCGRPNPVAFAKLHDVLMLHFAVHQKVADSVGQVETAAYERYVIERLKKAFPDVGTDWPPA